MADLVEIILALRNVRAFISEAGQAEKAVAGIGYATEKTGKQAATGWKGVAKWAGGAAALYGASRFVKSAVGATESLAQATLKLQRSTNLDTETASEWAALAKERGISTQTFQQSLVKLSREMEKSRTGTSKQVTTIAALRKQIDDVSAAGGKKAPGELAKLSRAIATAEKSGAKARATLKLLGVSQADVAKGNTREVLTKVADAFKQMPNHATRAALAQQLFGRSGQALVPILMKGSKGVQELLDKQKSWGNYLTGKSLKDTKHLIEQQREMEAAFSGVKVQLGTALMPILVQLAKIFVRLLEITRPLTKNALLFKIALGLLVVAFIAYKVAVIASTIASLGLDAAMLPIIAIVLAIVVAIGALAVGFYFAYTRVGWFRDAMKATWQWVKGNWPLLLGILIGPFGVAAVLIIKHFAAIKRFVLGVVTAIRQAFDGLLAFVRSIPDKIGGIIKSIPGGKKILGVAGGIAGHFAAGGIASSAGRYLVGERGPEVVSLPRGAAVQPNEAVALAGAGGTPLVIHVPVMLDGREIARSTARVTADRLARR